MAAPPSRNAGRIRLTSVAGTAAALCVAGSFFLPWFRVEARLARTFQRTAQEALARESPPSPAARDFARLADSMVRDGEIEGTDLQTWVEAAELWRAAERPSGAVEEPPTRTADAHARYLSVVRGLLWALPVGAGLVGVYFLLHRLRRARAPALILCVLVGASAVVLAGALRYADVFLADALQQGGTSLGLGWTALLWGGAGLALAGFFGVSARNWFQVYAGSVATGASLAFLVWRYLEGNASP